MDLDPKVIAERAAKAAIDYLQAAAEVPFPWPVVKAAIAKGVATVELHGGVAPAIDHRADRTTGIRLDCSVEAPTKVPIDRTA